MIIRFLFNPPRGLPPEGESMRKVDDPVPFPSNLTLDVFENEPKTSDALATGCSRKRHFELYGVVEHFGTHRDGHYVAYTRAVGPQAPWYRFSDSKVTEVSEETVLAAQAFLLFYAQTGQ